MGATAVAILLISRLSGQTSVPFADDFSRPNGASIGNGWSDVLLPATSTSSLRLLDGAAVLREADVAGGIYRTFDFGDPITIDVTFTGTSGFAGLPFRYVAQIAFLGDGSFNSGIRLSFYRGDANYNDSSVSLNATIEGENVQFANVASSFQYGSAISVHATRSANGTIAGFVRGEADQRFEFSFSAPVTAPSFSGSELMLLVDGPDSRSSTFIYPSIDNVSIVPEFPSTTAAIALAAFAATARRPRLLPNWRRGLRPMLVSPAPKERENRPAMCRVRFGRPLPVVASSSVLAPPSQKTHCLSMEKRLPIREAF